MPDFRFPLLSLPTENTAERTVRLGDSCISGRFPRLSTPEQQTAERTVRLGDSCISGRFPRLR